MEHISFSFFFLFSFNGRFWIGYALSLTSLREKNCNASTYSLAAKGLTHLCPQSHNLFRTREWFCWFVLAVCIFGTLLTWTSEEGLPSNKEGVVEYSPLCCCCCCCCSCCCRCCCLLLLFGRRPLFATVRRLFTSSL